MIRLLLFSIFLSLCGRVYAQDIPLFSQKLTNSFMYNPAMAGHSFGSLTTSYRANYSNVAGAPVNWLISVQTPLADGRFGIGGNAFTEKVGVMNNAYYSGAFAYHLKFGAGQTISMGVGAEYNSLRLRTDDLSNAVDVSDEVIQRYSATSGKPDFSFGLLYQNRFLKAGFAANRLSTALFTSKDQRTISNYYSAYVQGIIPMRGAADVLEPYFAFRKFTATNQTIDLGVYYTFDDKIILGAAIRNGSVLNMSAGFKVTKSLVLGYSREMIAGNVAGFTGSSNEYTLRINFSEKESAKKFKSDYKSSLSYRRKTLNTSGVKKKAGGRTPKQLSRAQKRVAAFSPNKRYQNMSKLSGGKKSRTSAPKTKSKKRKPSRKRR